MDKNIFDQIKLTNEYGAEYWDSRELAKVLGYSDYRNFENAIQKAKVACENSKQAVSEHFGDVTEPQKSRNQYGEIVGQMVKITKLSRYACYLITQNGDPRKEEVALAQTYFAIQTRKQEVNEQMLEDSKRILLRDDIKKHNKNLAETATNAGVQNYAVFQNFGYMGLYGGLGQKEIHTRKKLKPNEKILDHMGSEELAANLFRATQIEAKLKREGIKGELKANQTHFDVGKKIRGTIKELGGTMPENLSTTDSIKKAEKRLKNKSKKSLI